MPAFTPELLLPRIVFFAHARIRWWPDGAVRYGPLHPWIDDLAVGRNRADRV